MMAIDDPKRIVASGYDDCANAYMDARAGALVPELALLTGKLSPAARVLDIGCGAGVPVTAALARVATVVGVDISASQIELARRNVPSARLIQSDIMEQEFDARSFDAVVAFYMVFHLPRGEQQDFLVRLSRWIRPGGYLLATLPGSDHHAYIESDFFGATMYWSHYDTPWYIERLSGIGFEILHQDLLGHGYREESELPSEEHPIILARLAEE